MNYMVRRRRNTVRVVLDAMVEDESIGFDPAIELYRDRPFEHGAGAATNGLSSG